MLRPPSDLEMIQSQKGKSSVVYNNFCQRLRNPNGGAVLANKLRQFRQNPKLKHLTMMMVEGIADAYFFNKFIDEERVQLFIACGKSVINSAISIIETNLPKINGFIAVLDADYDDFLSTQNRSEPNIIRTGNSDIEIKLLSSESLDALLVEYGNKNQINSFLENTKCAHVREAIFRCIYDIGCLRLVNEKTKIIGIQLLNFEGVVLRSHLNLPKLILDFEQYIQELIANSPTNHLTIIDLKRKTMEIVIENHEPNRICRGHDAIEILKIALQNIFGNPKATNLNIDDICEGLRIGYNINHFQTTLLYNRLKEWESQHNPYVILN